MKTLVLETSTFTASVAVWADGRVLAGREARVTTHSEELLALVDQVLDAAGLRPADLDAIACGAGPGSFTGLRIGLATAKGLCFALGLPLVTVSSLAALALDAADAGAVAPAGADAPAPLVLALLDARKGELYAGLFRFQGAWPVPVAPEAALAPEAVARWTRDAAAAAGQGDRPVVVVGEGALAYPDAARAAGRVEAETRRATPSAGAAARLAVSWYEAAARRDEAAAAVASAVPHYIRPSEAEAKLDRAGGGGESR